MVLTERELELIKLIAGGYTDNDIATTMGVSRATVRFHIDNVGKKMGVNKKVEIAVKAVREGLI